MRESGAATARGTVPENTAAALTVTDPPVGYPEEWEQDAALKDGGTIRIRPIVPGDRDALQAMVRGGQP